MIVRIRVPNRYIKPLLRLQTSLSRASLYRFNGMLLHYAAFERRMPMLTLGLLVHLCGQITLHLLRLSP